MLLILLGMAAIILGGVAVVVFFLSAPFLLKPSDQPNRYGPTSPTTSVAQAIEAGFRRGLDFSGRANPLDFWFFALFVGLLCGLSLAAAIGLAIAWRDHPTWWAALPLLAIPLLGVPSLAVAVRRLHDINRSGLWLLLLLVFGYFILIYWFFQPSQENAHEVADAFD